MNTWRLYLLFTVFFCLSVLIVFRLFFVQVIFHNKYAVLAENQHWITHNLPARRGKIFTSDNYPLVVNKTSYLLYAEPPRIENTQNVAEELTNILFDVENYDQDEIDLKGGGNVKKEFASQLQERLELDLYWVAIAHKLTPETQQIILDLELEGLGFEEEPIRSYPENKMAAHILGFVGADTQGKEHGYYGLEGYYDGDLRGRPGKIMEERSAKGHPILIGGFQRIPPEDGADLVLTLERSVQYIIEKKLAEGVEKYGAKSGSIVLLEPSTGQVMALANYPTFNPSFWWKPVETTVQNSDDSEENPAEELEKKVVDSATLFKNAAISSMYEPGSVIKALTMSTGIDTDTVMPQTTFQDIGPIRVSGFTVDNWDKKHHGEETMIEVLQHSNNMGAAWLAQKLGPEKLYSYFTDFGVGVLTNIDLEGEDSGWIMPPSQWRDIDLVSVSFGQAISVTPLQLATSLAAIVNEGVLMQPYIVKEIRDGDKTINFRPKEVTRVLSASTSRIMVEMLTAAAEGGEASFFISKRYKIAGKTGTAQIAVGGKYLADKTNTTFIGFLPEHPQFVMVLKLEEPSASIYAAETAVPLWMDILEELVTFYNIPPSK